MQICTGIAWGMPADPATLVLVSQQIPKDAIWATFGISRMQFPFVAQAVLLGGHVRVGLEDNIWLEKGVLAPSNAALVERAIAIIRLLGGDIASPDDVRSMLRLRGTQ